MARHIAYVLDSKDQPVPVDDCDYVTLWKAMHWDRVVVGKADIGPYETGYFVSTVFLGFNHNFRAGPPLLWETRIAGLKETRVRRYRSRLEAEKGHQEAVAWATAKVARAGGIS